MGIRNLGNHDHKSSTKPGLRIWHWAIRGRRWILQKTMINGDCTNSKIIAEGDSIVNLSCIFNFACK